MLEHSYRAPEGMRVGHAHLRVSDLERSIAFYQTVLGLNVQQRYGNQAAFLAAGDYHHHLGLNTWGSKNGAPPPHGSTGLFHVAYVYPTRADLARAVKNVLDHGVELSGAADHGVSVAVYFDDPDGNGIELYYDRDMSDWPRNAEGELNLVNAPVDLEALLAEA